MSKRIALICKGKSDPNTGKDCSVSKLNSLTNNVNRVASVLSEHGNWIPHIYEVTTTTKLKDKINEIKENGVDEFLFYYTGHGRASSKSFEIVGVDECDIDLVTILEQTRIGNRAVSIILDACESKAIADNWSNLIPYEILTATDDKAYEVENITGDGKWYSYFSYHFCEYMKNREHHTTLSEFNKYLINQYASIDDQKKQESNYRLPIINRYTKINTIVYGKQFKTIRKELEAIYSTLDDFKKSIFSYVPKGLSTYESIETINNRDELLNLLIEKESNGVLYCLLRANNIAHEYVNNFTGRKCCDKVNPKISKVMVIVNHDKANGKYDVGFYSYYDDKNQHHDSSQWITLFDWNNFLEETLIEKLQSIVLYGTTQKVELIIVLPLDRFSEKFELLKIVTGEVEGYPCVESLKAKFNISIKLFPRLSDYYLKTDFLDYWKENLINAEENTVVSYSNKCCHISDSSTDIATFKTDNGGNNLFLLKDCRLDTIDSILGIYMNGVPFMATSLTKHLEFNRNLLTHWEDRETKVKDFKEHTFEYLNRLNNVYFLYDDGYDEAFLSSYIEQGKKTNEERKNFIGMDNE